MSAKAKINAGGCPVLSSMMRISPKPPQAYPWYLWPFFWNQRRKYGAVLNAALLWARTPKVFLGVAFLYGMIDRKSSPLPPVLRSLLTVRVSQLNGCRFCVDINSATLLKRGVSLDKIEALDNWRRSDLFSELERVTLEYAEAVTQRCDAIDEDLMARMKKLFDDDSIIELTALIAFQNLSSKFNSALGVPPQGFCQIPPRAAS
jgi:AhpD family alkylhydroperoxidase